MAADFIDVINIFSSEDETQQFTASSKRILIL